MYVPRVPSRVVTTPVTIQRPMFVIQSRRYIVLRTENNGDVITAKVPFRYNRVMCRVKGIRTIQELQPGDVAIATLEYTTVWKLTEISI